MRFYITILAFLLVLTASSIAAVTSDTLDDFGTPDSIKFIPSLIDWRPDTSGSFSYDIKIFSDDTLSAFAVSTAFETHLLQVDSFLFSNDAINLSATASFYQRIDNDSTRDTTPYTGVLCGMADLTGAALNPATALDLIVGRVYVSINTDSVYTPQDSVLLCPDTLFFPPAGITEFVSFKVPVYSWLPKVVESQCVNMLPLTGDFDQSGAIDISDAVMIIAYIFGGGPAPDFLWIADVDCSGTVDISDAVYLIAFIFSGGPPPCE